MAALIGLGLTMALLIAAVLHNIYIGFPLLFAYLYFAGLCLKKGYGFMGLATMSWDGAKKAFIVIPILLLLGCLTATWMAAGTVAAFVYYCLSFISPPLFILIAFLATTIISLLLGSSLGTVGTVGIIIMAMAKAGGVNPYLVAGTVISAAYVGDRCSPMASALYLLSAVTKTDCYRNISMALKTTVGPFLFTAVLYLLLSLANPLSAGDDSLRQGIGQSFHIGFITFLPAIMIVALCAFQVNIRLAMLVSAVCAALIALFVQGVSLAALLPTLMRGFEPMPSSAIAGIIHGGGLWGMLKASFILLVACSLAGILLGIGVLRGFDQLLGKPSGRLGMYLKTMVTGLVGICCGCNQSIAIIITGELLLKPYEQNGLDRYDLARDISFTVFPLSSVIPWCLASMVPTTTLGIPPAHHLPYLFFPFVMPLWYGLYYAIQKAQSKRAKGMPEQ